MAQTLFIESRSHKGQQQQGQMEQASMDPQENLVEAEVRGKSEEKKRQHAAKKRAKKDSGMPKELKEVPPSMRSTNWTRFIIKQGDIPPFPEMSGEDKDAVWGWLNSIQRIANRRRFNFGEMTLINAAIQSLNESFAPDARQMREEMRKRK